MGFAISWLAIKGKEPGKVRDELGVSEIEEHEEFPESKINACKLSNKWYLIYINKCESHRTLITSSCFNLPWKVTVSFNPRS